MHRAPAPSGAPVHLLAWPPFVAGPPSPAAQAGLRACYPAEGPLLTAPLVKSILAGPILLLVGALGRAAGLCCCVGTPQRKLRVQWVAGPITTTDQGLTGAPWRLSPPRVAPVRRLPFDPSSLRPAQPAAQACYGRTAGLREWGRRVALHPELALLAKLVAIQLVGGMHFGRLSQARPCIQPPRLNRRCGLPSTWGLGCAAGLGGL